MKFVIHQSELDGKWYVAIKAANHEIWFTSEGYDSQSNAERSCDDFQAAILDHVEVGCAEEYADTDLDTSPSIEIPVEVIRG